MKIRFFSALLCFLLTAAWAVADEPFRNHRYDAFKVTKTNPGSIVFVGNSITNMHDWASAFENFNVVNRGVSGAVTQEVIDNLGSILSGKPAKIFFLLGTNDLGTAGINNTAHVIKNLTLILDRVKAESPDTEVYVQSIFPSTSGLRTLELLSATNAEIQKLCTEKGATYIDLWDDLMGIVDNTHSRDKLHLSASGYKIWCDKVAPYVGSPCNYPATFSNAYSGQGFSAAYEMRISCFGVAQVKADDVLFIGDEMINGGEWHELLHRAGVKNYGTAWGYPGPPLNVVLHSLNNIFKGRADNVAPAQVFLYAGVAEVNGSGDLAALQTTYQNIVTKIHELAPTTKVFLMSLQPTTNGSTNNNRVKPFNAFIEGLAEADEMAEYVDIYTDFVNGQGTADGKYFSGNYLYGKGYAKVARIVAPLVPGASALTEGRTDAVYALHTARNILYSIKVGEGAGRYTADNVQPLREGIDALQALVDAEGTTDEALQAQVAEMNARMEALLPLINQPAVSTEGDEHWFKLYTPLRGNRYATSNGAGAGLTGNDKHNYATGMWKFVRRADGALNIINRADGGYLNPSAAQNSQLNTSVNEPSAGWELSYAATRGLYIIRSGSTELNQTNASLGYKLYNWSGTGDGLNRTDAGCQFMVEPVEGEPDEVPGAPEPVLVLTDIALDGSAPYRIPDELAAPVLESEKVTVAIDVQLTDNSREMCLVGSSNSAQAENFCSVFVNTGGKFGVRFNNGRGLYTGSGVVGTARHKVVVTMQPDNPSYTYYLDGSKVRDIAAVSPIFSNIDGVNGLYLGGVVCSDDANKYPMKGTIHSVQFFPAHLTADEVALINYDGLVATGVQEVKASAVAGEEAIYTLGGLRVDEMTKGIYIQNGKKVLK